MDNLNAPPYPSVQGQAVPDLGLAQYGVATPETQLYTNSDSTGPIIKPLPELDSLDHDPGRDIPMMGIDPAVPYYHLNLAGEMGVPSPAQLAEPAGPGGVIEPTFCAPDMCVPDLMPGDLTGPGIDHVNELEPDPQTGDLLQFAQSGGLDIHTASGLTMPPDPALPDLDEYDRPAGLEMQQNIIAPDPLLPDLQSPKLEREVHMSDRPGDLASDALNEMHDDETYKELPTGDYNELYMDQSGMNTRRSKHMGMLDLGLEDEEGRKR